MPPELWSRHEDGLRRYRVTGESAILGRRIEVEALHADGSRVEVELSIVQLQDTTPIRSWVTFAASRSAAGESAG